MLKAAHELAYVPQNSAKSLASARYQTHAVVIGSLDGPYYSELLMGYEEVAARYDQELLLVVADRPRRSRTLADLRARVDGVMIAQMDIPDDEISALAELIPVVLVGRSEIVGCDGVVSESAGTATELTRHLIENHGAAGLVFVGDPEQVQRRRRPARRFPEALDRQWPRPGRRRRSRAVHRAGRGTCGRDGGRPADYAGRAGLRQRRGRAGAQRRTATSGDQPGCRPLSRSAGTTSPQRGTSPLG